MNEYQLAPRAAEDLRAVWRTVADDSARDADGLIETIFDSLDFLARNPACGDPWPRAPRGTRYHTAPGTAYVIFFRPAAHGVDILRVAHGAQDLDALRWF